MTDYINECVGCEVCIGCGADKTKVTRCDECGAICDRVYLYGTTEMCEGCAETKADEYFEDLTFRDKMDLFCWDMDEFNSTEGAEVALSKAWYDLELNEKVEYINDIYNDEILKEAVE